MLMPHLVPSGRDETRRLYHVVEQLMDHLPSRPVLHSVCPHLPLAYETIRQLDNAWGGFARQGTGGNLDGWFATVSANRIGREVLSQVFVLVRGDVEEIQRVEDGQGRDDVQAVVDRFVLRMALFRGVLESLRSMEMDLRVREFGLVRDVLERDGAADPQSTASNMGFDGLLGREPGVGSLPRLVRAGAIRTAALEEWNEKAGITTETDEYLGVAGRPLGAELVSPPGSPPGPPPTPMAENGQPLRQADQPDRVSFRNLRESMRMNQQRAPAGSTSTVDVAAHRQAAALLANRPHVTPPTSLEASLLKTDTRTQRNDPPEHPLSDWSSAVLVASFLFIWLYPFSQAIDLMSKTKQASRAETEFLKTAVILSGVELASQIIALCLWRYHFRITLFVFLLVSLESAGLAAGFIFYALTGSRTNGKREGKMVACAVMRMLMLPLAVLAVHLATEFRFSWKKWRGQERNGV